MTAVQSRLKAAQRARRIPQAPAAPFHAPATTGNSYGAAALAGECDQVTNAPEGTRNARLNIAAVKVAGLIAGGHIDGEAAHAALTIAARAAGLDDTEIKATIASGFRHGLTTPRVKPDLPDADREIDTWLNSSSPTSTTQPASHSATTADADTATDPDTEAARVREHLPLIDWDALWADQSREEWIVYPILPARRLIALYSPPKIGKSLLMLELAAGVARGARVLGTDTERPRRVLYVDYENDPLGDIRTRLQNMGLTPDDLGNLCYLSFPTMATLDTPQGAAQLMAAVRTYDCEVVVIDTVSRSVGGDENENDTWLRFYRETGLLLKQAGVALIRLDHAGKDETKGQRGGSAKVGDVDAVWRMTKRTDDTYQLICEAHRFPLPAGEEVLTIQRVESPLRHKVNVYGAAGAVIDALIKHLDDIDAPVTGHGSGRDAVLKIAADAGIGASKRNAEEAIRRRKATRGLITEGGPDDD